MIPSPTQNNEPELVPNIGLTPSSVREDGVEVLCDLDLPPQKGPRRRDIASFESCGTSELIRFVISPEGLLVPDLAHKLPGRGLWVRSDRQSLEVAVKKNLFARSAKRQVRADLALIDRVHRLLRQRCLEILGLARREGQLLTGFEKIASALKSGALKSPKATSSVDWLIEASNGAEDGRAKLMGIIRARQRPGANSHTLPIKVAGCFNNDELSLALGLENAIHVAILAGRRSERWSFEINRLAGFEPLLPPGWSNAGSPARLDGRIAPDQPPDWVPDQAPPAGPGSSTEDG